VGKKVICSKFYLKSIFRGIITVITGFALSPPMKKALKFMKKNVLAAA
jgi:hypothetical protein